MASGFGGQDVPEVPIQRTQSQHGSLVTLAAKQMGMIKFAEIDKTMGGNRNSKPEA
jgi:hypothetical protein